MQQSCLCTQNSRLWLTGAVQFAAVKFQTNDGKHENCKEEQQANLQQRNHGLHDRLEDYLQTWKNNTKQSESIVS